jgi:type III pantothenate kinase
MLRSGLNVSCSQEFDATLQHNMRIQTFDIGNTLTKSGIFVDGKLVSRESKPFDQTMASLRSVNYEPPQFVVISSVTRSHNSLVQWLESYKIPVMVLSGQTPLPFLNHYSTPETLGTDRLASIAGAHAFLPDRNVLVIDLGTCIKYDVLHAQNGYLGGNIAPGIQMRIDAMHHFTAKLPVVPKVLPENAIGNSTITALQNGAIRGAIYEIDNTIRHIGELYPNLEVIFSGGDIGFIQEHLQLQSIRIEPDIVLYGLHHIFQHGNRSTQK